MSDIENKAWQLQSESDRYKMMLNISNMLLCITLMFSKLAML